MRGTRNPSGTDGNSPGDVYGTALSDYVYAQEALDPNVIWARRVGMWTVAEAPSRTVDSVAEVRLSLRFERPAAAAGRPKFSLARDEI